MGLFNPPASRMSVVPRGLEESSSATQFHGSVVGFSSTISPMMLSHFSWCSVPIVLSSLIALTPNARRLLTGSKVSA